MTEQDNLTELYKQLEFLIGSCYEKHKDSFNDCERETCESFLYQYGEYELALGNLLAILEQHSIEQDDECRTNIITAKRKMGLDDNWS